MTLSMWRGGLLRNVNAGRSFVFRVAAGSCLEGFTDNNHIIDEYILYELIIYRYEIKI